MTHQTGIKASTELLDAFKEPTCRFITVSIDSETIVLTKKGCIKSSWEEDFTLLKDCLNEEEPAYILYKKGNDVNSSWILFSYVPDNSKVRDKMLYAATKATLAKQLGESGFCDIIHCTLANEITLEGYKKFLRHKDSEAPLTTKEAELKEIKMAETGVDIGTESRRSHVSGVSFPISNEILKYSFDDLHSGNDALASVFFIANNDGKEEVVLETTHKCPNPQNESGYCDLINDLAVNLLPKDRPSFVLFNIKPDENSKVYVVFVYICPSSSSIKEKMVYSSARSSFISWLASQLEIHKRLEISDLTDLTALHVKSELGLVTSPTSLQKNHGFIKKISRPGKGK